MSNETSFIGLTSDIKTVLPDKIDGTKVRSLGPVLTKLRNDWANSVDNCEAFVLSMEDVIENVPDNLLEVHIKKTDLSQASEISEDNSSRYSLWELINKVGVTENLPGIGERKTMTVTSSQGDAVKFVNSLWDGEAITGPTVSTYDGFNAYLYNFLEPQGIGPDPYPPFSIYGTRIRYGNLKCLRRSAEDTEVRSCLVTDLVYDLKDNSEVCSVLVNVLSLLLGDSADVGIKLSNIASNVPAAYDSAKSVAQAMYNGWVSGGLYGVIVEIIKFVKGPASATVDDGALVFTDNSSLIPKSYLSGVLGVLGSVLSAIGVALAAAFTNVLGILMSVVGSVITNVFGAISYNINVDEHPAMTTSLSTFSSAAPFGVMRARKKVLRTLANSIFLNYGYVSLGEIFIYDTYGGVILVTISNLPEDDPDYDTHLVLSWEFHPDIVDRRKWWFQSWFMDYTEDYQPIRFYLHLDLHFDVFAECYKNHKRPLYKYGPTTSWDHPFDDWMFYSADEEENPDFINGEYGVLSDELGTKLINIVSLNAFIFWYAQQLNWTDSIANRYTLDWVYTYNSSLSESDKFKFDLWTTRNGYVPPDSTGVWVTSWDSLLYPSSTSVSRFFAWMLIIATQTYQQYENGSPLLFGPDQWVTLGSACSAFNAADDSQDGLNQKHFEIVNSSIPSIQAPACSVYFGLDDMNFHPAVALMLPEAPTLPASTVIWAFRPPKTVPGSTLMGIILGAVVTVAVTIITVAASVSASKKISKKRASLAAKTENAWAECVKNPSPKNVDAYRKACRKNNMFATFFGGAKYNKNGFWAASDSSGDSVTSSVGAMLQDESAVSQDTALESNTLNLIFKQITGINIPSDEN